MTDAPLATQSANTSRRDTAPELSNADFERFRKLIYEHTGIYLAPHKSDLIRNRLFKRVRELGLSGFGAYYERVSGTSAESKAELVWMIDAITTNKTEFFRETSHFDYLKRTFFHRWADEPQIRLLSAGCSSGEEPYSIAMVAHEVFGESAPEKVRITAVDLSTRVLERAKSGIYPFDAAQRLGNDRLKRFFLEGHGRFRNLVRVAPALQQMIDFSRRNLVRDKPMRQTFHGIFCCNVAIYFDRPTQQALFEGFYERLVRGGNLFVGHSESMVLFEHRFRYVQPSLYEKPRIEAEPAAGRSASAADSGEEVGPDDHSQARQDASAESPETPKTPDVGPDGRPVLPGFGNLFRRANRSARGGPGRGGPSQSNQPPEDA